MNTIVAPLLDAKLISYPYVSFLDEAVKSEIQALQGRFTEAWPGQLWVPEPRSLHITLLHLLSPNVKYDRSAEEIYQDMDALAHRRMQQVIGGSGPVKISAGQVEVSPAAIIVKWDDGGQIARLREAFTAGFELPELTKRPPSIVHTTIARFLEPIPVTPVERLAQELRVSSVPTITEIDLLREIRIYLQEFEMVRRYKLQG